MPSLSQWLDRVGELETNSPNALTSRLNPATTGGNSWRHKDAKTILDKLNDRAMQPKQRVLHARMFVRWLRANLRAWQAGGARTASGGASTRI